MPIVAKNSPRKWVVFLVLIAFLALAGILIDFLQASGRRSDRAFFWFAGVLRAVTFLGKNRYHYLSAKGLDPMAELAAE
jgi:hypothetical protein